MTIKKNHQKLGILMGKFKQHYMIKLGEGEVHPLFRLAYLPENFASFLETMILFIEGFVIFIFCTNLLINIFNSDSLFYSATLYMINKFSTGLFSLFHVANTPPYDLIAIIVTIIIYYFTRRYFEYVKYNLHIMRGFVDSNSDKSTRKQN